MQIGQKYSNKKNIYNDLDPPLPNKKRPCVRIIDMCPDSGSEALSHAPKKIGQPE